MPLPLLALAAGAIIGNKTKGDKAQKVKKRKAVSGYKKKNGTKVKAYTRE